MDANRAFLVKAHGGSSLFGFSQVKDPTKAPCTQKPRPEGRQRKADANETRPLAETRRDLLAHALQRAHDFFVAEQTSAIELRQDAIEAELAGQILEAHRHRCWSSDNHFIAQRIFIADGLQRLASLGAFRAHTVPLRRALELESERPVELHD